MGHAGKLKLKYFLQDQIYLYYVLFLQGKQNLFLFK